MSMTNISSMNNVMSSKFYYSKAKTIMNKIRSGKQKFIFLETYNKYKLHISKDDKTWLIDNNYIIGYVETEDNPNTNKTTDQYILKTSKQDIETLIENNDKEFLPKTITNQKYNYKFLDIVMETFGTTSEDDVFEFMRCMKNTEIYNYLNVYNDFTKNKIRHIIDFIMTFSTVKNDHKRYIDMENKVKELSRQIFNSDIQADEPSHVYTDGLEELFKREYEMRTNPLTFGTTNHLIMMFHTTLCFDDNNQLQYLPKLHQLSDIHIIHKQSIPLKLTKLMETINPFRNYYCVTTGRLIINNIKSYGSSHLKIDYIVNKETQQVLNKSISDTPRLCLIEDISIDYIKRVEDVALFQSFTIKLCYEYCFYTVMKQPNVLQALQHIDTKLFTQDDTDYTKEQAILTTMLDKYIKSN